MKKLTKIIISTAAFTIGIILVGVPQALATFPGEENREIAFIETWGNIATINPDGSGYQQLTTDAFLEGGNMVAYRYPQWSPDGSQVVYFERSDDFPSSALHVIDDDGTNRITLSTGVTPADSAWSPDGAEVAMCAGSEIRIYPLDGSAIRAVDLSLIDGGISCERIDWSVSNTIAVSTSNGIYTLNSDGSNATHVTSQQVSSISWSPDGTKLLTAEGGPLSGPTIMRVFDTNGNELTVYDAEPVTVGYDLMSAVWSPDGEEIAFMSARLGDVTKLYVMNAAVGIPAAQEIYSVSGTVSAGYNSNALSWRGTPPVATTPGEPPVEGPVETETPPLGAPNTGVARQQGATLVVALLLGGIIATGSIIYLLRQTLR